WVGFEGAPTTELASVDGTLKDKNVGLGLVLLNDHIGVSERTGLYGNYSYHLKVNATGTLAMGLKGGVEYYNAWLRDLIVWDANDQVFTNNVLNKFIPVVGAGLYYYTDKYYGGFSVPNVLSYKPSTFLYLNLKNEPQFVRHYYLTGGYIFKLNDCTSLKPSVLVKYVQNAPVEADFNLNMLYANTICFGVSVRTGDAFLGMVELYVMKNLRVGYAYDYSFTEIRNYGAGSHEIKISYDLGKAAGNAGRPMFW